MLSEVLRQGKRILQCRCFARLLLVWLPLLLFMSNKSFERLAHLARILPFWICAFTKLAIMTIS